MHATSSIDTLYISSLWSSQMWYLLGLIFQYLFAVLSMFLLLIANYCFSFCNFVGSHIFTVLSLGVVQDAFKKSKGTIDGAHTGAVLCGHKQMALVCFYAVWYGTCFVC